MNKKAAASTQLYAISQRLHYLVYLRAALAPFRAALLRPVAQRELLALWRPCQNRLDRLLDAVPQTADWAVRMRLARKEMEDNLLDEVVSPVALSDLVESLEQMGEVALLEIERDLRAATADERQQGRSE